MAKDLFYIFQWYVYLLIAGILYLPLTEKIFNKFFDRGYIFSKVFAIISGAYISWLLASFRILPFNRGSAAACILIPGCILYLVNGNYKKIKQVLKDNWRVFLKEEILLLVIFVFWCYIRGLQPDIHGIEKYMDFGYVNSILRSSYMPPQDMWYAGESMNYYYFGHYICAFLTKLTAIPSYISYNLMLAIITALTFVLTFSVTSNAVRKIKGFKLSSAVAAGIIAAMLLTFGGNLHTFIYAKAIPYAKSIGMYSGEVENYFYADSTRYIGYNPDTNDKTISEFPSYAFVVGDLHGHVSDIYLVITIIGLLLALCLKKYDGEKTGDRKMTVLLAFFCAVFYMTNAWDYPIYITVSVFAFFYRYMASHVKFLKAAGAAIIRGLEIVIISQIIMLPFTLNFENMTGGVGIVEAHSPLYQLAVLWGYQLVICLIFVAFLLSAYRRYRKGIKRVRIQAQQEMDENEAMEEKELPKAEGFMSWIQPSDAFVVILIVSAFGLILLPEIIYIIDIYPITYHRANTMFKFTYQSSIMLAISIGYIMLRIVGWVKLKVSKVLWSIPFAVILVLVMMFPVYAIDGYYGNPFTHKYKGLDGQKYLEQLYKDDYYAVKYLEKNVKGDEVVLEANGDAFSEYERISAQTGLATIVGWGGHEWLWRGSNDGPSERSEDVKTIYESDDIDETKRLLRKYDVSYIVIGKLERQKFENLDEQKLIDLGEIVFDMPDTIIIKLR